jgi:RNA polymerase sigma-70 factor (ECF subfamily)
VQQFDGSRKQRRAAAEWEEFVEASYPTVWRFCASLAGAAAADDLAQETFLRATRALPQLRSQASRRTWILSIARRACMDDLRGRYRREQRDQRLEQPGVSHVADASDEIATRELLSQLEPDRRTAFTLTQLFGLTYDEAAAVCGCPVGTVRSRVARARDDLIELIEHPQATGRQHSAD